MSSLDTNLSPGLVHTESNVDNVIREMDSNKPYPFLAIQAFTKFVIPWVFGYMGISSFPHASPLCVSATLRETILHPCAGHLVRLVKKSFPLSSTRMKAGKFSTRIFHTASIPSSGNSTTSCDLMCSLASKAAGPPAEPR